MLVIHGQAAEKGAVRFKILKFPEVARLMSYTAIVINCIPNFSLVIKLSLETDFLENKPWEVSQIYKRVKNDPFSWLDFLTYQKLHLLILDSMKFY